MHLNFTNISSYGLSILALSFLPLGYISSDLDAPKIPTLTKDAVSHSKKKNELIHEFTLGLSENLSVLPSTSIADQLTFSIDPPRPTMKPSFSQLLVRIPRSKQTKRVCLPCKIGLTFNAAQTLEFTENSDLFWLECSLLQDGKVSASLFVRNPSGTIAQKESWESFPQLPPVLSVEEIPKTSPFRALAEGHWWGQDLFAEKFGDQNYTHKVDLDSDGGEKKVEIPSSGWIVYKDHLWQPGPFDQALPIARIKSSSSQFLEMEGWEGISNLQFKIPISIASPLKTKGEELFSQLRVRSEKQISCVIDKQSLILRLGDWVVKTPNRWKILRKKEEKEAFLTGIITGDLFILDKIDAKSMNKSISGQLFSQKRSQVTTIEYFQPTKAAILSPNAAKNSGKNR